MKTQRWILLFVFAMLTGPAMADLTVGFDEGFDFSPYRTYAWTEGTPAVRPQVEEWIVLAIERQLEAKGIHKARDGQADLHVLTYTLARSEIQAGGDFISSPTYGVALLRVDVRDLTVGTLMVDLLDGRSDEIIWRAVATETFDGNMETSPNLDKVRKKIDKITKKMFKQLPIQN